jgi:hypothetical protein
MIERELTVSNRLGLHARATAKLVAVQLCDRFLRVVFGSHFHEREPARTPGHPIAHHGHGLDGACLSEQRLEVGFHRLIRKVSNEQFAAHGVSCV